MDSSDHVRKFMACRRSKSGRSTCVCLTSYGNSDSFFCHDCSTSSESLCQVRAISISMDRILKFAARSAIRWHSTACCRHSTGVIIVALMTPHSQTEARPRPNSGPITRPESMCAGRFKISVARRQHSNSWRRRGPDGSGVLLTFRSLRPHREQIGGRPNVAIQRSVAPPEYGGVEGEEGEGDGISILVIETGSQTERD
jgi:hypothetical protein